MNSNLMAVLSLVVIIGLFAVLIGFVNYLTQTLTRTGNNLVSALAVTTSIRQDCESIVQGVLALNRNLNAAAAGLVTVAGSAKQRAASLSRVQEPSPTPSEPQDDLRPQARWATRTPPDAALPNGSTRTLREPSPQREVSAIGASRREFRVRAEVGSEQE